MNPWNIIGWLFLLSIALSAALAFLPIALAVISRCIPVRVGQRWKRLSTKTTYIITEVHKGAVTWKAPSGWGESSGTWTMKEWRRSGMYWISNGRR